MMKAKKVLSRLVIAVLTLCMTFGVLSLVACGDGNTPVDQVAVTLSSTTATVQVGKQVKLTGTVNVEGAKLTWTSADESIATVSNGTVKGVKAGKTNITATYDRYSATCEVTVIDAVTVTLNKTELDLTVGGEETLTATASNGGTIEWSSSDASIAKVENGKVTALKEGTAYIYAENSGSRAMCEVNVTDPSRKKLTFSGADDMQDKPNEMFYWSEYAEWKSEPYYTAGDDTYHFDFANNAGNWYNIQLFYKNDQISGANNSVKFKVNTTVAGHITVNGNAITLAVGDNDVMIDEFTGFLSVQFGLNNGSVPDIVEAYIKISGLAFETYTPAKLATPTALAIAEDKTVTITDTNEGHAKYYILNLYQDGEKKSSITVNNGEKLDDGKVVDGTYDVKVTAYSTGRYTSSDEFDAGVQYTVANGGVSYDLEYSGETAAITGTWYYWKEQNNGISGSYSNNKLTLTFENNAGNWYNIQLFYLDTSVDKAANNKIAFKVNSTAAGHFTFNGNVCEITEENVGKDVDFVVYNLGTNIATVSVQMGVNGSGIDMSAATVVFTFENPMVSTYEPAKLTAPSIALGENNAYTITDTNEEGVDGYELVYTLKENENAKYHYNLTAKTGTLNVSQLPYGEYTVTVIAKGSGRFTSSDASTGVDFTPSQLQAPTVAVNAEDYTVTVTDENNAADTVGGYVVYVYSGENVAATLTLEGKTGTIDITKLVTGKYTVKAVALGTALYCSSNASEAVEVDVVNDAGIQYEVAFGQAADDEWGNKGLNNDGLFYYWNDQNWAGATVTMNETPTFNNGTITLKYTVTAGGTGFAVQLFCKDTSLVAGKQYTLTFKINVAVATTITINGEAKTLTAGDNEISVTFTATTYTQPAGACSFSLQIHGKAGEADATNTVVISEIVYTEVVETPAE